MVLLMSLQRKNKFVGNESFNFYKNNKYDFNAIALLQFFQ